MGSIVSKIADEIKLHGSYEAYQLSLINELEPDALLTRRFIVAPFFSNEALNGFGQGSEVSEEIFWIIVASQLKGLSDIPPSNQVVEVAIQKLRKYIEAAKEPFVIGKLCFQIETKPL